MQRMEELAMSFPSLVDKPGVKPWDALTLEAWACGPVLSHDALMSARLLLMIWAHILNGNAGASSCSMRWRCGMKRIGLRSWAGRRRGGGREVLTRRTTPAS